MRDLLRASPLFQAGDYSRALQKVLADFDLEVVKLASQRDQHIKQPGATHVAVQGSLTVEERRMQRVKRREMQEDGDNLECETWQDGSTAGKKEKRARRNGCCLMPASPSAFT